MAFTVSGLGGTVWGNKNVKFLRVTADAATDAVASGFNVVESVQWCPQSMTTAGIKVKMNQLTAATASNGYIAVTGCASGDIMYFQVVGR